MIQLSFLPSWTGTIAIPPINTFTRIGKAHIRRLILQKVHIEVELIDSTLPGYFELKHSLPHYPIIVLKKVRRKKVDHNFLEIKVNEPFLNETQLISDIKIIAHPAELDENITPDLVNKSWIGKFKFKTENIEEETSGLRPPQIGAVHAIAAHFSVGEHHDKATIVLPTGTGKTETMISSMVYLRPRRVLVLVPSKILRRQITDKFLSLGILKKLGVLGDGCLTPFVAELEGCPRSLEEVFDIVNTSNVVVAIPNSLKNLTEQLSSAFYDSFSDLYIDEAHHATAATWDKVRSYFQNKRITQYTATPFRNDKQEIGGKIIFNYRLGDAQKDGYYKQINFIPVENYKSVLEADREIAQTATTILQEDLNKNLDHLMMVRADSILRANDLYNLYTSLAPQFSPVVVHSGCSSQDNKENLHSLISRESRIVICSDMLGEGYDFPHLKIAAIHDYHKSLALSLQFIGRFTRKAQNVGNASVITNIADPKIEKGLEKLYAADASWDEIIKRLSEDAVEREIKLQEIIADLKSQGALSKDIPLYNLRPNLTAQLYKNNGTSWSPTDFKEIIPQSLKYQFSIGQTSKVLIIAGVKEKRVKWGKVQEINDIINSLTIIYWNKETNGVFVYSSDFNGLRIEAMIEKIFGGNAKLISGDQVFNVLNNVEMPLAKNLGSSRTGVISFTQYFGPNVTEGLAHVETNLAELSNIACLGYEDGERVIWGAAKKKGKIWSMSKGKIDEWMDWCNTIFDKVTQGTSPDNITTNFLRPTPLSTYHNSTAISADWGEHLQHRNFTKVNLVVEGESYPLCFCEIDLQLHENLELLNFSISYSETTTKYSLEINEEHNSGYLYQKTEGQDVFVKIGRNPPKPFLEYIIGDPIIINYVDGSYSYHNYLVNPALNIDEYPLDQIQEWDWTGIPLNQESMGKEMAHNTIQYKTFLEFENEFDLIINDDGPGEAADLVCIKHVDNRTINLTLIHCKNATKAQVTGRIDNLYVLCGQAQKSAKIKHRGLNKLYDDIKRRESQWQPEHTRFLKGDMKLFSEFKNKARTSKLTFDVIVVQPGLSKETLSDDMKSLIATTELYLKKKCNAGFLIIMNKTYPSN